MRLRYTLPLALASVGWSAVVACDPWPWHHEDDDDIAPAQCRPATTIQFLRSTGKWEYGAYQLTVTRKDASTVTCSLPPTTYRSGVLCGLPHADALLALTSTKTRYSCDGEKGPACTPPLDSLEYSQEGLLSVGRYELLRDTTTVASGELTVAVEYDGASCECPHATMTITI